MLENVDLTGKTLGHFQIQRQLGAGGMAIVYKAHEMSLNRVVALKVIGAHLSEDPDFVERFRREAQAAARLNHANIVQIYSIGEAEGLQYFAMEYVEGRSVKEIVREEGVMSPARALPIVRQVADALQMAHEAGVVHRDIKPANIMVDSAGRVKVADFGIALMTTDGPKLTATGSFLGTPEYVSPEQCHGEKVDGRSDIYSLGISLYEMLAGKIPFAGETPASLVLQIVEGKRLPLRDLNPDVPEPVVTLVDGMTARQRSDRFATAAELMAAIDSTMDEIGVVAGAAARSKGPGRDTVLVAGGPDADEAAAPEDPEQTVVAAASAPPGTETPAAQTPAAQTHAAPAAAEPSAAAEATPQPPADATPPPAAAPAHTPEPPPPPPPAAVQESGSRRSMTGVVIGLAVVLLLFTTVVVVAQFAGRAGEDPLAEEARPVADDTVPPDDLDGVEEPATTTADAGGATGGEGSGAKAADPGSGNDDAHDGENAAGSGNPGDDSNAGDQRVADGAAGGAGADAKALSTGSDGAGDEAAGRAAEGSGGEAGSENLAAATTAPPATTSVASPTESEAAPVPAADTVVVASAGEYEYVEMVAGWVEQGLARQRFSVIVPLTGGAGPQARFEVAATARLVGRDQLEYFGRSTTQYTVSLTLRAVDLVSGRVVAGPEIETVKYTTLNAEQNLRAAVNRMLAPVVRELRTVIR